MPTPDPKKEYESLMRYLQGSPLQRTPAPVPEPGFSEEWKVVPQPTQGVAVLYPDQPATTPRKKHRPAIALRIKPLSRYRVARLTTAAVAVLVLIFVLWKGYRFYQLSPQSLFDKAYIPFAASATSGATNSIETYYAEKNYIAATLRAKKQRLLSDREQLLAGLAYLQRADYTKAIKWLEPVANNFKNPYRRQGEYYLTLAYLQNEDYDRCIERMERIVYNTAHPYHNRFSQQTIDDVKVLKWK